MSGVGFSIMFAFFQRIYVICNSYLMLYFVIRRSGILSFSISSNILVCFHFYRILNTLYYFIFLEKSFIMLLSSKRKIKRLRLMKKLCIEVMANKNKILNLETNFIIKCRCLLLGEETCFLLCKPYALEDLVKKMDSIDFV